MRTPLTDLASCTQHGLHPDPSPLWECEIFRRHFFLRALIDWLHLGQIGIAQELTRTVARILGPPQWEKMNKRGKKLLHGWKKIHKNLGEVKTAVSAPLGRKASPSV